MTWLVLLVSAIAALAGAGLAYVIGAAAVASFYIAGQERFLAALPQRLFAQVDSFTFLAMPLFILAGELMTRGGITRALVDLTLLIVGRLRGGLGHVGVATSVFLSGISGSAVADAAALSNTLVPEMTRRGYARDYAAALVAAASMIGPIIPPSIVLVFYGALMNVSVAGLFAAGFLPGLLLAAALIAMNAFSAWRHDHPRGIRPDAAPLHVVAKAAPALALPAIILSGIVFGVTTPTEAAALAVAAAVAISFLYGIWEDGSLPRVLRSQLSDVRLALLRTTILSGSIFAIMFAAGAFEYLFALQGLPRWLSRQVAELGLGLHGYLALVMAVLLLAGTVMEAPMVLVLFVPILAPPAIALGADPIHLGTVICFNLSLGLISPPLGGCLMVVSAVTGVTFWRLSVAIMPFFLVEVAVLAALVAWPDFVLFVPRLVGLAP
ncbi:MAG: TRAP transporter large permease [Bradyrhizobiaceae bacterium]|nr:MAG: TRAP transporter large permease [Bradyrhizobiaceae bacterium]